MQVSLVSASAPLAGSAQLAVRSPVRLYGFTYGLFRKVGVFRLFFVAIERGVRF